MKERKYDKRSTVKYGARDREENWEVGYIRNALIEWFMIVICVLCSVFCVACSMFCAFYVIFSVLHTYMDDAMVVCFIYIRQKKFKIGLKKKSFIF